MREKFHLIRLWILCLTVKFAWTFEPQPIYKDIPEDLGIDGFILNIPQEAGLVETKPHLKVKVYSLFRPIRPNKNLRFTKREKLNTSCLLIRKSKDKPF